MQSNISDSGNGTVTGIPGYDMYGRKLTSHPAMTAGTKQFVNALQFQSGYTVQSKVMSMSALINPTFAAISLPATATGAILGTNRVFVNAILAPNFKPTSADYRNFAIPYMTMYEGTSAVGSMIIYPTEGDGIAVGRWQITGGLNSAYGSYTGTNSTASYTVFNGGIGTNIYVDVIWKFTVHDSGDQVNV